MNFDDISAFLDLVSNPDKYAKALKELKDEREKLTTIVEATAKLSEIDIVKKSVDAKLKKATVAVDEAEKKAQEILTNASAAYAAQVADVLKQEEAANKKAAEALELKKQVDEISAEFRATRKQLEIREANLLERERKVAEDQAEVAARIEKLRGVMG